MFEKGKKYLISMQGTGISHRGFIMARDTDFLSIKVDDRCPPIMVGIANIGSIREVEE